jgi:hypothetical protein
MALSPFRPFTIELNTGQPRRLAIPSRYWKGTVIFVAWRAADMLIQ